MELNDTYARYAASLLHTLQQVQRVPLRLNKRRHEDLYHTIDMLVTVGLVESEVEAQYEYLRLLRQDDIHISNSTMRASASQSRRST